VENQATCQHLRNYSGLGAGFIHNLPRFSQSLMENPTSSASLANTPVILASSSKTRRDMLEKAGITFTVVPPKLDEETEKQNLLGYGPTDYALQLAKLKAMSISQSNNDALVIGTDQTLHLDNNLFNKAATIEEALSHLHRLRGQTHVLRSAVVCCHQGNCLWSHVAEAHMTMRNFSELFVQSYVHGEADRILSAVGCYQLEGRGSQLFESMTGDYFTVLGLPLFPLLDFLRRSGILDT
jgi:septum formation protein